VARALWSGLDVEKGVNVTVGVPCTDVAFFLEITSTVEVTLNPVTVTAVLT